MRRLVIGGLCVALLAGAAWLSAQEAPEAGPGARTPGRHAKYHDVFEIKSRNERTLTSRVLIDGKWETMVTIHSRRKA